jgi:peptidoglycan/xylan/chitin deacetylase (PgdA/CDA1 family)
VRRVATVVIEAGAKLRALALALKLKSSPPVILMYHGVSVGTVPGSLRNCEGKHMPADLFAQHLRVLQRSRRVISLSDMIAGMEQRQDMRNTVALTFDDGYENNLLAAAPALADFKMPAAFFVATGFIGAERCIWFDKLEIALDRTNRTSMQLPGNNGTIPIRSLIEKRQALVRAKKILKAKETRSLDEDAMTLVAQLGVTDFSPDGDYRFMDWNQVRQLVQAGFEVGAHTVSHPILSKIPFDEAVAEILDSKEQVRQETGQCSSTFCFPNGKMSDFSPALKTMCQGHFKAVLTAERGAAAAEQIFELKRLSPAGIGKGENIEWMLLRAR